MPGPRARLNFNHSFVSSPARAGAQMQLCKAAGVKNESNVYKASDTVLEVFSCLSPRADSTICLYLVITSAGARVQHSSSSMQRSSARAQSQQSHCKVHACKHASKWSTSNAGM